MSVDQYSKIIEQLLNEKREAAGYDQRDKVMQLIYDRGYLIGLLCFLAQEDNYVAHKIEARLKNHKHKK